MRFDYVLVGGGLQGGLLALALRARKPDARLALVERGPALGGNHTWSFHDGDVLPSSATWLEPLVAHRFTGYDVRFPGLERRLHHTYFSVTSERLHEVVGRAFEGAPGSEMLLAAPAETVEEHRVVLRGGRVLEGEVVVDARGPEALASAAGRGYQKFLGLELQLRRPSRFERPMLMDATVPQLDGFRFVYVLPFAPDRVLVEDTYYSDSPGLDREALRERVLAYGAAQGLEVVAVRREEQGVLPIPWTADAAVAVPGVLLAGYAGGLFHPTTGYSMPVAVRLAEAVASAASPGDLAARVGAVRQKTEAQARFCRLLNWMLFRAYPPEQRYHVLERFYRLPESTVRRFYALELTLGDRARLLVGRPPAGLSLRAAFSRGQAA